MIKRLKKIFPSLITVEQNSQATSDNYSWFTTETNDVIGIKKEDINEKDHALLALLLTPLSSAYPPITAREKQWFRLLFEDGSFPSQPVSKFRFIYFSLSKAEIDPIDFRAAIDGLYSELPAIIWVTTDKGIIIEEKTSEDQNIKAYYEMIEVFASDFYVDVKFLVGPYLTDLNKANYYFKWIETCYSQINQYSIKAVMTYVMAVPYLLPSLQDHDMINFLVAAILKDCAEDESLLRTIQTYLESNSNTTLAAKEMYMHRNSLQYRIDKFIEKTGIDVKQFEGALSVYLVLLIQRHFV
ncbi:PucR C-terminal helix-turn-helix domain-containing protein [Amphibacillus marinus]|uniref:PucR C-terminal helix-turn-helix domain-containing protein n=1 Tax=Amphibacillus marinus TaxID=872970 RepID=A0A1H8Q3D4_9BACI|nr:helix-turn-helix domain-containing protein [Amphibacillus marinus]SEO48427.1 PucR C-terminal helix-turn-helix domain-containing protein [Amphibacillus marinus]